MEKDGQVDRLGFQVWSNILRILSYVDSVKPYPLIAKFSRDLLENGHGVAARATPCSPKIKDNDFIPLRLGEIESTAVKKIQGEWRGGLAHELEGWGRWLERYPVRNNEYERHESPALT